MANYAPNTPSHSTRNPHTALAWYQSGRSIRIQALNLTDWVRHVRALAALEVVGGVQ